MDKMIDDAEKYTEKSLDTVIGNCRFCGQTFFTKIGDIVDNGWGDAHEAATMKCTCGQARVYQARKEALETTIVNIDKLFNGYPEVADLMKDAAGLLVNQKINSIAVKLGTCTTFYLKRTTKGAIKVEKKKNESASLES